MQKLAVMRVGETNASYFSVKCFNHVSSIKSNLYWKIQFKIKTRYIITGKHEGTSTTKMKINQKLKEQRLR